MLVKIDEGPQTLVNTLAPGRHQQLRPAALMPLISGIQGQPYSEANIASDRDAITYFYYNHGFPNVEFESSATPAPGDPQRMNVVYKISEGPAGIRGPGGHHRAGVHPPYMVNRQMRIQAERSAEPEPNGGLRSAASTISGCSTRWTWRCRIPTAQEPSKDVLFNLQEAKRWTFRYGGGIEFATGNIPEHQQSPGQTGVSPNGVLEITRLNMFGLDQTLTMRARVGLLTRRGLISYDAPRLFPGENWRITVSAFYDNTADVNTFASERLEGSIQAEQRL